MIYHVKDSHFVISATKPSGYPPPDLPEIAFAGRSNVGKSSLMNALLNRKNLVKTSSKPGKTRLLNFFDVNGELSFVDLPGYGYAKTSKAERAAWGPMMESYLGRRSNLRVVVVLLDVRREPNELDKDLLTMLLDWGRPVIPVITKCDKLSRNKVTAQLREIEQSLALPEAFAVAVSSHTKQGIGELWRRILPFCGITTEA